jgi:hypothetical protein
MQRQHLGASILKLSAPSDGVRTAPTPTQASFDGDWNRHSSNDRLKDLSGEIRVTDESRATAFLRDFADGTSHVDVDQKGPSLFGTSGCVGHRLRAVIEELNCDGAVFGLEVVHLSVIVAELEACGVHHFGEQQGIPRPSPH